MFNKSYLLARYLFIFLFFLSFLVLYCTGEMGGDNSNNNDAEADSDGDSDTDVDGDTDSDSDTDVDGDTDSDSDTDVDGDTDSDSDTDVDTDTDIDSDTDTDSDPQCDEFTCIQDCMMSGFDTGYCDVNDCMCQNETDADADTDSDTDSDTDGDTDGDGECPWGNTLPAYSDVGLAESQHIAGGTAEEREVFDRMNYYRSGTPLVWNDCLGDLARSHSQDMVERNYYGHGTAGNTSTFMVSSRANAAGLTADGSFNENVLTGDLNYWLGTYSNTVDKWMTDGHAIPIQECNEVGVGIDSYPYLDTTIVFVTADFICP